MLKTNRSSYLTSRVLSLPCKVIVEFHSGKVKEEHNRPEYFRCCPSRGFFTFTEWHVAITLGSPVTSEPLLLFLHFVSYQRRELTSIKLHFTFSRCNVKDGVSRVHYLCSKSLVTKPWVNYIVAPTSTLLNSTISISLRFYSLLNSLPAMSYRKHLPQEVSGKKRGSLQIENSRTRF